MTYKSEILIINFKNKGVLTKQLIKKKKIQKTVSKSVYKFESTHRERRRHETYNTRLFASGVKNMKKNEKNICANKYKYGLFRSLKVILVE